MTSRLQLAALACLLTVPGCTGGSAPPDGFTTTEWDTVKGMSPLPPVPADPTNKHADNPAAAKLGQKLFFEKGYSGALKVGDDGTNGALGAVGETGKVSCASCHLADYGWAENRSKPNNVPIGANRAVRNSPSLVNVGHYEWFTWAGRLDTLWTQGSVAPESPDLAGDRCAVVHVLWAKYRAEYDGIFEDKLPLALDPAATDAARFPPLCKPKAAATAPDGPWEMMAAADKTAVMRAMSNVGKSFAAFERKLVSGNAPFDKYVAGDTKAISASAKRGLKLFIGKGFCVQCHTGPIFTDQKFHNLGVPQTGPGVPAVDTGRFDDLPKCIANPYNSMSQFSDSVDAGTAKLSGLVAAEIDKGAFRTKNLRGVALTAPFEHNGVFNTLAEVVEFYSKGGGDGNFSGTKDEKIKPLNLTDTEKADLVAYLETLTGEAIPAELSNPNPP
jgi:cytochrome c peroxidase